MFLIRQVITDVFLYNFSRVVLHWILRRKLKIGTLTYIDGATIDDHCNWLIRAYGG